MPPQGQVLVVLCRSVLLDSYQEESELLFSLVGKQVEGLAFCIILQLFDAVDLVLLVEVNLLIGGQVHIIAILGRGYNDSILVFRK